MRLLRFIPIKLTIFLIFGILSGYYFDILPTPAITAIISILGILGFLFYKNKKTTSVYFGITACIFTICLGILAVSLSQPKNRFHHYSKTDYKGVHQWDVKVREVLKPSNFSDRYILEARTLDTKTVSGKLVLNISKDSLGQRLQVDDELIVFTSIQKINPPLNPHQFDYANYMEKKGVYHQAYIDTDSYVKIDNPSKTILGIANSARTKIISKLKIARFGNEELGIIQALLLGQRNDISEATYNNYKNAGAVHILAVSGLHIGILLLILQFLLRPLERLPKGKTIKLLVIVVLLWGFAMLAGLSASIVRAVTMFSFVAYALYLNRPSNTFNILALSMFFILLMINPLLIFQVGFQMSYAAVLAIVWIYPLLQKFWFPKNIIIRKIWQLLSVSAAAQIGVLPISLFYFHQFPGLFFISNLIIVPFLGVILGIGILVIVLALLNALPPMLVVGYNNIIGLMNYVIEWVAEQEAFIFRNISFDFVELIIAYIIIFSLILTLTKSSFKRFATLLVAVIGFQLWQFYFSYQDIKENELLVFHQTKNTILAHRYGKELKVFSSNENILDKIITNYKVAERIKKSTYSPLQHSYSYNNQKLIRVDSSGIYVKTTPNPDFVLLSQSPKIHLDRLIDSIRPKYIIADGSNYRSYVNRWKATCAKRKLPFHYTGEKGAYILEIKD